MTDNNGLDVLIAWSIFVVLLLVLLAFLLHTNIDPLEEVQSAADDSRDDDSL